MKPIRFHDAARAEPIAETQYYAAISPRLAERLFAAVQHATQLAAEFPEMGSPYKFGTRRVFSRSRPFSLIYVDTSAEVHVLALAPLKRKPSYWRTRKYED